MVDVVSKTQTIQVQAETGEMDVLASILRGLAHEALPSISFFGVDVAEVPESETPSSVIGNQKFWDRFDSGDLTIVEFVDFAARLGYKIERYRTDGGVRIYDRGQGGIGCVATMLKTIENHGLQFAKEVLSLAHARGFRDVDLHRGDWKKIVQELESR